MNAIEQPQQIEMGGFRKNWKSQNPHLILFSELRKGPKSQQIHEVQSLQLQQ